MKKNIIFSILCFTFFCIVFGSCQNRTAWMPGTPLAKEEIIIGVIHINDPFTETSGYSFAHEMGIIEMIKNIGLEDSQVIRKVNVFDGDPAAIEEAMRDCIGMGANVIIATSWRYMDVCERLAREFPSVIFAHTSGHKYNDTNFTNFFGRAFEAKYLAGIIAGMKTQTNRIGFVAPWGTENREVTSNLNAFAMGVEKVNPQARVYVIITHSWFDPLGEAVATRALISLGCDIISQDTDSPIPQIEAQNAGIWGIGYNSDMSLDAPNAVLTSVIWRWGVYYTSLVQSVINGTFTTTPWYGSLKTGIVDLAPLNDNIDWSPEILLRLEQERNLIESGTFMIFGGEIETNEGILIDMTHEINSDREIRSRINSINWHYRNIVIIR